MFIPFLAGVEAIEADVTATGAADFGRRLALRQGIEILGPVGVAARTAPTVGRALEPIAARLAMHPETLQRRLADEGTTFEELTEAVRQQVVDHYLRQTRLPLSQLAALAGYSEQSALSRSCRRWFGTTPSAYRRDGLSVIEGAR